MGAHPVHPVVQITSLSPAILNTSPPPFLICAHDTLQKLQRAASLTCMLSAIVFTPTQPVLASDFITAPPPTFHQQQQLLFASIPLSTPSPQQQQRRALTQLGVPTRRQQSSFDQDEESTRQKIDKIIALSAEATAAVENSNDYSTALRCYTDIIRKYPDLALAERARISRGLLLYQVGKVNDALLQLEDEEVALRGSAEVHAALAAIFYDLGKPLQAEQQWTVATEFDKRYIDLDWVQRERHWPPKLLASLQKFLSLS